MRTHVDIAVIGLGSAGEAFASAMAGTGRSVVGFEPDRVGGECPFTACMPSKVLLHHAAMAVPDWVEARRHRDEVVDDLDDADHFDGLVDAGVQVVRERAHLAGERRVRAGDAEWTADTVVIATGSKAVIPPIEGLDRDRIWTSDDLMTASELPASCVIVGGGVIGCESAAILAGFGSRVALVEGGDDLLDGLVDPTVAALLRERLCELGVDVRVGGDVERVTRRDGAEDEVQIDGGAVVTGDVVLVAVGQAPVWGGLGLDHIGLGDDAPDVDDDFVVAGIDWLRAIGDVDGRSPWTHAANHEAERLRELLTGERHRPHVEGMPNCVFTDPPVASVGMTAEQAEDAGYDVVTGSARSSDIARFATDRLFDGGAVVVADRRTGRLLGCSGIGARFDETISIVAALLASGTTLTEAARFIIPFPTMSQILTPAFEDALKPGG